MDIELTKTTDDEEEVDLEMDKDRLEIEANLDRRFEHRLWQVPYEFEGAVKYETRGWFNVWQENRAALLCKARNQGLDATGLDRCLSEIGPDPDASTVLIPIGAFLAMRGKEEVWIIACRWEYYRVPEEPGARIMISHIRFWALRASDAVQIAFSSCG